MALFGDDFLQEYMRRYPERNMGVMCWGDSKLWCPNGSKTYIDRGDHPEHSTAEARTIRDAVIHYKAGELLMNRIFASEHDPYIQLFKNNVSYDPGESGDINSFACHENYLTAYLKVSSQDDPQYAAFMPFLATRQIFDGAGYWNTEGNFFLSQRAFYKGHPLRRDGFLPFCLKGENPLYRMHVASGDSTILEFASFLKLGTTSLVLSLIEEKCFPEMRCRNVGKALYDVSRFGPKDICVEMVSGECMSAYDIQVRYWEAAEQQVGSAIFDSDETAAECAVIIKRWEQALNAIWSNDTAWMLGRFDWATKRWVAEHIIGQGMSSEQARSKKRDFDIFYHLITDRSLQDQMNARWPDRRIATDSEIEHAVEHPPVGTRAAARGDFVREMHTRKKPVYCILWDTIYAYANAFNVEMPNPLGSYHAQVERLIEEKRA